MDEEREPLSWRDRADAFTRWRELGLSSRHANALVNAGYSSLNELRTTTDFDLTALPNVGKEGRVAIYRLLGKPLPSNQESSAEIRARFEQQWQSRLGDERLNRLLDEIVDMAGDALDKGNLPAAQALWDMARRRRASRL